MAEDDLYFLRQSRPISQEDYRRCRQLVHQNQNAVTYIVGEDASRLQHAAHSLGLQEAHARRPMANVRASFNAWLQDTTLESARMHSVGALGLNERVDSHGDLHFLTLRRHSKRRSKSVSVGAAEIISKQPKSYGTLDTLFQPLEYDTTPQGMEVEGGEEEEEIVEEEEVVDIVEGGSLTAAIFGIVKGTVGPAILYLPRGFQLSGWAVAITSMILATTSYLYSAYRLLQCWKLEKQKLDRIEEIRALLSGNNNSRTNTPKSSPKISKPSNIMMDPHHGSHILLTYPELARRAFGNGSMIVQFGIAAMQFGVCLTYLIFVPQNLVECFKHLAGWDIPKLYFLILMVLMEIPLSWIRDIRKLTPTNILATLLISYGLLSCLLIACFYSTTSTTGTTTTWHEEVDDYYNDPITITSNSLWSRMRQLPHINDTWFLFVGTSFFVFEGSITLIVPLQEAVFRKEDKEKFPMVNIKVTCWIVVFYILFAMICWASFGSGVKTALTASLPPGILSTAVQFAYSVAVIFTFPLQAFPALEVVFHNTSSSNNNSSKKSTFDTLFQNKNNYNSNNDDDDDDDDDDDYHNPSKEIWKRNVISSLITILLGIVAYLAIDYLGNVVSLLGSLVGIPIALIYPPLMHNQLCKDASKTTKLLNIGVAFLGVFAMGAASFTTIMSWDKGAES